MYKKTNKTIGEKCIESYPNRIPIVVDLKNDKLSKIKNFLVDNDSNVKQLLIIIRRQLKTSHTDALHILIDDKSVDAEESLSELYSKYKNPTDGCLHLIVIKENTFLQ